jgi:hypothetical protein
VATICLSATIANGCTSWKRTSFTTEHVPTNILRARVRTIADSGVVLRNVIIARDSLTGFVDDDSLFAVALRDVRSLEVQTLDGRKIVWVGFMTLSAVAIVWASLIYLTLSQAGT